MFDMEINRINVYACSCIDFILYITHVHAFKTNLEVKVEVTGFLVSVYHIA